MAGISEPNFTSLSLIYAMWGAIGVYQLSRWVRTRTLMLVIVSICYVCVILTASRSGFIGATFGVCLFLLIEQKVRLASIVLAVAIGTMGLNLAGSPQKTPFVIQRMKAISDSDRSFTERAWNDVRHDDWFVGGGPRRVGEWADRNTSPVPHNSLLDIGLAFGKGSLYFYGAVCIVLLAVNVRILMVHWHCRNHVEKVATLTPLLFLSLFPMYMTLSAGLAMDFIMWMVLGAYPLLHRSPARFIGEKSDTFHCRSRARLHLSGCDE